LKNLCIFYLDKSLLQFDLFFKKKTFNFSPGQVTDCNETILKNLYFLPLRQVAHYNEIILKNLYVFHLGKSPVKILPFLKNICVFHLYRLSILKNLSFSTWQVAHYNKTILKYLDIFHLDRPPIIMKPF